MQKVIALGILFMISACTMTTPSKECLQDRALQSESVKQQLQANGIDPDKAKSIATDNLPIKSGACTPEELETLNAAQTAADIFN